MKEDWQKTVLNAFNRLAVNLNGEKIAVAVSGGGDSMALVSLFATWCRDNEVELLGVSVDHGLRLEAKQECKLAASLSANIGIQHHILEWQPVKKGNLQDNARKARHKLISNWAKSNNIKLVALAHTMDDQAETVLINLSRGSGVDGLAAMPEQLERQGVTWIRPLLQVRRYELREYLIEKKIKWAEDPSNDDNQFDRVKARKLFSQISQLGLSVSRLATTASRMQYAKNVLDNVANEAVAKCAFWTELGEISFTEGFWDLPVDIQMRLSADSLQAVSGNEYRPRYISLATALTKVRKKSVTLSGCILKPMQGGMLVMRELSACGPEVNATEIWDNRWRLLNKEPPKDATISSLGNSVNEMPKDCQPHFVQNYRLMVTPALWRGGEVWAAPFAGLRPEWRFVFCRSGAKSGRFPVVG